MEYLFDLGSFTAKAAIVVIAFTTMVAVVAYFLFRGRGQGRSILEVENLNDHFKLLREVLQDQLLDKKQMKALIRREKKEEKEKSKDEAKRPRVFVLDFDGDLRASAVEDLRHEVTSVLTIAEKDDEVVVRLDSPGGMVSPYGLAASQLSRLKEAGIKLTVCVDTVAASGGYMMACVGHRILAAPFAIVGSIGVVASVPNFHRLLEKNDVEYREITAGEFKRTISMLGEITPAGMQKFKEQIEDVHALFKMFVTENRPQVDIQQVATGEYWYGTQAMGLRLVDEIQTSDDYLYKRSKEADLFEIHHHHRVSLGECLSERLTGSIVKTLNRFTDGLLQKRPII